MKRSYARIFTTLLIVGAILVSGCVEQPTDFVDATGEQLKLKRFSSESELEQFLNANINNYFDMGISGVFSARTSIGADIAQAGEAVPTATPETGKSADIGAEEYSTTNIQVEGVDEADIVKNDGKYIYAVTSNKVVIVYAYPPENAEIVSEIEFEYSPSEIYINGDKLVVFSNGYFAEEVAEAAEVTEGAEGTEVTEGIAPGYVPMPTYKYGTIINVYDVSDRSSPVIERNLTVSGHYYDSRMIGDYVYAISNDHIYYGRGGAVPLPMIAESGVSRTIPASQIYYFDLPDHSYMYTNIVAFDTQDPGEDAASKTFLMGYSNSMYASTENMYIVYTKRVSIDNFYDRLIDDVILPIVPANVKAEINQIWDSDMEDYRKYGEVGQILNDYIESLGPEQGATFMQNLQQRMEAVMAQIAKEIEKTVVHKIALDGRNIEYKTAGEVPGHVLNQFSMDEHDGYFRIATTTGSWRIETANHLYVLDSGLEVVGKVEDLAAGERIYSTRFMGDKGYMVTFRQVDPLFVIDLSSPTNPQVLGYLKVPGVSDYLHPYDDTHIIGIGRDATEEGVMKGMKLALFDVSDFSNPVEVSKYIIGESGTSSEALYDHKAFLFDRDRGLLVIPVSLSEERYIQSWEGAYVFGIYTTSGFTLKGRVTHQNETNMTETEYGYKYWENYDYNARVRRSLYMDDVLYTVSNRMIKMNDLNDIDNEINKVELPYATYYPQDVIIRQVAG